MMPKLVSLLKVAILAISVGGIFSAAPAEAGRSTGTWKYYNPYYGGPAVGALRRNYGGGHGYRGGGYGYRGGGYGYRGGNRGGGYGYRGGYRRGYGY